MTSTFTTTTTTTTTSIPTPSMLSHPCLSNVELLFIFTSHLSSSDLVKCLSISKLWNQVAHYHLWSSKTLSIPSLKSNQFLNFSINPHQTLINSKRILIKSLKINLSQLSNQSIFINQLHQLKFHSIFKSIKTLTLNDSLNLSCFLSKLKLNLSKTKTNSNQTSTSTILNHRQEIHGLRQTFYQTLIDEILKLEDLVNLNLINFLQSDSSSSTSGREITTTTTTNNNPEQNELNLHSSSSNHHHKQNQFTINDFLINLSNGSTHQTSLNLIRLKSLNITTNHQLIDDSLDALSRSNPFYDSFQNPHLSSYLNHLTLIDCPLITQDGFFNFLKSCQNLKSLKLGQMDQLFKSQDLSINSITHSQSNETLNLFDQLSKHSNQLISLTIQDISILLDTPTNSSVFIKLDSLHLTRCHITSNLLRSFSSLKELNLYHTSLEDQSRSDYHALTDHFDQLNHLSLSSIGTRSFTIEDLNRLILKNSNLKKLIIDGYDRASRLRLRGDSISKQILDQDLLTEAFHQTPQSFIQPGLPEHVLKVYGPFDILFSKVPSNLIIYILSHSKSLEGIGLFGRSNEIEFEHELKGLDDSSTFTSTSTQHRNQGMFLKLKDWWKKSSNSIKLSSHPTSPLPSPLPHFLQFKRSQTFYLFDLPLRVRISNLKLNEFEEEEDDDQVSKRLMKDEIRLLKSHSSNLINVWV